MDSTSVDTRVKREVMDGCEDLDLTGVTEVRLEMTAWPDLILECIRLCAGIPGDALRTRSTSSLESDVFSILAL